ncbi:MAG: hypothetical protein QM767_09605 [Anaeromyxobacter sp.]
MATTPKEEVAELGQVALGVGEDDMQVVAHHADRVDEDAVAGRGHGEHERDDEVRELGGPEEELPLRAAPGDQVGGAGDDASRRAHDGRHGRARASLKRRPASGPAPSMVRGAYQWPARGGPLGRAGRLVPAHVLALDEEADEDGEGG